MILEHCALQFQRQVYKIEPWRGLRIKFSDIGGPTMVGSDFFFKLSPLDWLKMHLPD